MRAQLRNGSILPQVRRVDYLKNGDRIDDLPRLKAFESVGILIRLCYAPQRGRPVGRRAGLSGFGYEARRGRLIALKRWDVQIATICSWLRRRKLLLPYSNGSPASVAS